MPIEKNYISFAGGEISPSLYAHVDLVKYATGLRTCLNFIVQLQGGVVNRPGMEYIQRHKDLTKRARLIPFEFSITQNYILEFTEGKMRVYKDAGLVLEPAKTITGISKADPGVVTIAGHGYSDGDWVWIDSVVGMTEVNSRFFKVANKTANTFELNDLDGNDIDTTGYTTYTSGGEASRIFELTTPYLESMLRELKYTQSADIMTLCHPDFQERELSRTQHYAWGLDAITWDPKIDWPTALACSGGAAGTETFKYKVTAIAREDAEESLSATNTAKNITGITQADPGVVTIAGHGYSDGDELDLENIGGMTELNGERVLAANVTANTFEIQNLYGEDIDTTGYTAYTSGGTAARALCVLTGIKAPTTTAPVTITWTGSTDANWYNIYKEDNGIFGYIGFTKEQTFDDYGIDPDLDKTPPQRNRPFDGGNYPGAVAYHNQRRIFAGTNLHPQTFYGTRVGNFSNMNVSTPLQDDDSIKYTLDSDRVQQIRHITSLKKLIMLTSGSTWLVKGGVNDDIITPSSVKANEEYVAPCSHVKPLRIGRDIIYVEEGGKDVLYLNYTYEADGVDADSLTLIASHLLKRREIVEWTYCKVPFSVIWCVTDTGELLSLTYNRKQQIWAWARHETNGYVESVASILEDNEFGYKEDYLYLSVRRTINGSTVRYIERMHSRDFHLVEDCFFVDSALTLDNWNSDSTSTMVVSGGTDWTTDETLTLTEIGVISPFVAGDVGKVITLRIKNEDGDITARCQFEITAYTSSTIVDVQPITIVPSGLRNIATSEWGFSVKTFTGLDHLEGEEVAILADGNVEPQQTVENGSITIDNYSTKVHIGLPYNSDIETLDIDFSQKGLDTSTKKKGVSELAIVTEESRGFYAGPDFDNLTEYLQREDEDYDEPTNLLTGRAEITIQPTWGDSGRIAIREADPLPLNILAITPKVEISD